MIHNPEVGSSSLPRATKAISCKGDGLLAVLLLFGLCLGACHRTDNTVAAITKAMDAQEQAWDRGDIPGFMTYYSDTICFLSPKGRRCGKAEVQASYERNYPDQAAMGDLQFGVHEVLPIGRGSAWCTGTWQLHRNTDTIGGGFSLLWVLERDGWRIVRDHTY